MFDAVRNTFNELWTMRDPNAGDNPFRTTRPKVKTAIRKFLGVSGTSGRAGTTKGPIGRGHAAPASAAAIRAKPDKPPIELTPIPKKKATYENAKADRLAKEPFIQDKGVPGGGNSVLPKANKDIEATRRLQQRLASKNEATRKTSHLDISPKRRQFLFLNIGDQKILEYLTGTPSSWANLFPENLSKDKDRVYFDGLPVLLKAEKKRIIKKAYFNPGLPVSIYGLHDHLRKKYANLTRRDVTNTLRTLEVYQRMRARQLPKKITGRIEVYRPGFLAADTIYPSTKHGWRKHTIIFTVVDMWSRYTGAFLLSDKRQGTVAKAFERYLENFMSLTDVRPRKLLIDKGSELKGLDRVMQKYCGTDKQCVFRSLTGQPVNIIEGLNAQVQRMAQVYNEAGIVSSYDDVLYMVVNAINNQARPDRMGYSPVELLQMNAGMRQEVNSNYKFRNVMTAEQDPLDVGTLVRILMLNRKEQVSHLVARGHALAEVLEHPRVLDDRAPVDDDVHVLAPMRGEPLGLVGHLLLSVEHQDPDQGSDFDGVLLGAHNVSEFVVRIHLLTHPGVHLDQLRRGITHTVGAGLVVDRVDHHV